MKTIRFFACFIALTFFLNNITKAQNTTDKPKYNTWSVTLSGGSMLFYGDLRQFDFYPASKQNGKDWYGFKNDLTERQMGIGLAVTKQLNPFLGVQGFLHSGKLSGYKRSANAYFNANILAYGVNAYLNISNLFNSDNTTQKFKLYGILGLGFVDFKTKQQSISSDATLFSYGYGEFGQETKKTTELVIPIGLGLKYNVSKRLDIGIESTMNNVNTDKLDARVMDNTAKDKYGYTCLTLTYKFGKNEKSLEWNYPQDTDGDGVADKKDKCSGTPADVKVDVTGCPIDSDLDGVGDYLDNCPNTPKKAYVDSKGCPLDADADGVADYLDLCPSTPKESKVDINGCPIDSDGDGVADYLDKCGNTTKGLTVDTKGCPVDTDEDGVADYLDKCPNTPKTAKVDVNGCPIDTDGDGVADYMDKCPTLKGIAANKGCPEVKKEEKEVFKKALQGIKFETNKDVIKPESFKILDNVVNIMNSNPQYNLQINGHTDNVGKPDYNIVLSQKRAEAVKNYLVKKGIDPNRMTAEGFGDTKPVADNKTVAGRTLNRRVEFLVVF